MYKALLNQPIGTLKSELLYQPDPIILLLVRLLFAHANSRSYGNLSICGKPNLCSLTYHLVNCQRVALGKTLLKAVVNTA